jgi:hypothetical protein
LASCHLLLLKSKLFLSIQMAHIVTPISKVHEEFNFLTLLDSCLLNKHYSSLKVFSDPIVFIGSQSWKRNEKANSHALVAVEQNQNLWVINSRVTHSQDKQSIGMLWLVLARQLLTTSTWCHNNHMKHESLLALRLFQTSI